MAYAQTDVLADRHVRLRQALVDRDLDAIVVTHLPNVFYLTNFAGSSAIVVMTRDALLFITDFRYVTAVETSWASPSGCPNASLVVVRTSYDETLVELLRSADTRRIGFEAAHVPFAQYRRWAAGLDADSMVSTERLVEAERVRKDAHEVGRLRRGAEMLTGAFGRILAEVQPGRTERQVAAHIDWTIKDVGFERSAFDTIVASGPNGALPHARPGARRLEPGDLVVLDFGGVYDGYCVDLTRTVSLGDPDAEARRIYAAVVQAHRAGVAATRPGATAREIDRAARGTLEGLGLGEAFGHGTGHGLGIEVHEEPWLRKTERPEAGADQAAPVTPAALAGEVVIEPGMVFTIEPGAYVPGWGGVRLEDDVLVTDTGHEVLTQVPRDLAIV
jgi:Xaa-Pro aminopeptidase